MADHRTTMILRCPVCFARENDVTLLGGCDLYYCVKCSFAGDEATVRAMYARQQEKFGWRMRRVTMEEQDL